MISKHPRGKGKISNWRQFERIVRSKGCHLLDRLDKFPNSVLVTGCQRSGTTMISRIITQSAGMVNYWFGSDDELDAALILSSYIDHKPRGRYCFQTTYLNECYIEYYEHINNNKIIWVLRNPFSVVHSMLYNWRMYALNELFRSCGQHLLDATEKKRYEKMGVWGVSKTKKACYSYNTKMEQLIELKKTLPEDRLMIINYEDFVRRKKIILPKLYKFIDLPYNEKYAENVHPYSILKALQLSDSIYTTVNKLSMPIYKKAKEFIDD